MHQWLAAAVCVVRCERQSELLWHSPSDSMVWLWDGIHTCIMHLSLCDFHCSSTAINRIIIIIIILIVLSAKKSNQCDYAKHFGAYPIIFISTSLPAFAREISCTPNEIGNKDWLGFLKLYCWRDFTDITCAQLPRIHRLATACRVVLQINSIVSLLFAHSNGALLCSSAKT